jgi:glycosyltransferase involved in cell wall biosynthesis
MRVLHLDAGKTMRGGQWQALRLIQALQWGGPGDPPLPWVGLPSSESTLLARLGSPLFEAAVQAGIHVEPLGLIRAALLARRHDLIHAHDSRSHTLAALVGGAPLVVSRRVAFSWSGLPSLPRRRPCRRSSLPPATANWKYARPARYIAVSEFVKSVLLRRGVPADKIAVVYDGVPLLDDSAPVDAPPRILAPANADDPRKGAALALEAARLAGVELHLSDNLERDLPGASLFLYITHSEGLGSGALLAMSAGVPVIASNVGGLPEILRHGENGWLVENTPDAIAAAIRRFQSDPALARGLGRAGRRTVVERFTIERMVRRTMEVYMQVLQ